VRSEFEKESDSGTSVASDPVRGEQRATLVATAPEMFFILNCPFHQQRTDTLEYQLSGSKDQKQCYRAFDISRNTVYIFIYCRFERVFRGGS
jgi:hypothetical protein